jgi:FKBP-type peptidyl-prolyl cis-trans isomerase SlyD
MIKEGSKVKFHYTLTVDGKEIENSKEGDPLAYTHGGSEIIPGLEEKLTGMGPGDSTSTEIPPEKGYGPPDPEAVQKVDRKAFAKADTLKVGDFVAGEAEGKPLRARIAEVGPEHFTVDFNHPLAGKTLQFTVEVIEVS